jgi:hypothetical protein
MSIQTYRFPFDTCEPIQKGIIQQPYSALVNLLSIIVLIVFTFYVCDINTLSVLLFFIFFEIIHILSHIQHMQGPIQSTLIHLIAYGILFTTWWTFQKYVLVQPSIAMIILWFLLFFIDLIIFVIKVPTIYIIISSIILFLLLFFMYWKLIFDRRYAVYTYCMIGFIYVLVYRDRKNDTMPSCNIISWWTMYLISRCTHTQHTITCHSHHHLCGFREVVQKN